MRVRRRKRKSFTLLAFLSTFECIGNCRKMLPLIVFFLCSTICADEEEVSTNEGEEADDADEEEDGAE